MGIRMDQATLATLLDGLVAAWENEVVEFKQADHNYSTSDIGKYFSALANEANLRGVERAWLVFGVHNKTRQVIGTDYRPQFEHLQSLKMQIADDAEPSITFRNIHELVTNTCRVLLFEIPAAPRGIPIAWKGHYYARAGESLVPLGLAKQDEIRQQTINVDWSAQVVNQASLDDLDPAAVQKAREAFALKHANRVKSAEVMDWSVTKFLDRARITQGGKITRTALLLLGKAESAYFLSPHPVQITWKLDGTERAYQHFGAPFLLSTTDLYQKIRNFQLRLLPVGQLVPHEIAKYDQKMVLEALHNCIAHQDYGRHGRIVVVEKPDRLVFENEGNFFDGQPEDYSLGEKLPRRYRNPFLVEAMAGLNMIDKMGYGIHDMHLSQAKRYMPMPDYDLSEPGAVKLTIYGGVVDSTYTQMLMLNTNLRLTDVLALDRIQKKLPLPDEVIARLKRGGLIEGRKPNFHVSAQVAKATTSQADYIRTRAQDDEFYAKLLTDYLEKFGQANREEINKLLLPKISEALDDRQRLTKVSNLLTKLRRKGVIVNTGSDTSPRWQVAEKKL